MKKKVFIIFKYPHEWNAHVIDKFSNYYDTEHLYISEIKNKNFTEIVNDINSLLKSKNIETVVFDVDYFKFINFFFIERINCQKKIIMIGDDIGLHEFHSITASSCDLVLNSDPLAVLKYREKGYEALFFQFDFSNLNKDSNIKKEIDVLFYGHITPDRKIILDYIEKEGIALKNVGHENNITGLPQQELLDLISKSKIVLNLSKTRTTSVQNYASGSIYSFYYQLKGKIIVAGLKGVACVSEYSPGQDLLFSKNEVPTFFKKEECVEILKKILKDKELLEKYTKNLALKAYEICEDKKNFEPIFQTIEKTNHRKVNLIKFPYWYLRISAKHILLRNIKLTNLLKSILQIKIVFSIIKNTTFLNKLLILAESIINIFWYSIVLTFKQKK